VGQSTAQGQKKLGQAPAATKKAGIRLRKSLDLNLNFGSHAVSNPKSASVHASSALVGSHNVRNPDSGQQTCKGPFPPMTTSSNYRSRNSLNQSHNAPPDLAGQKVGAMAQGRSPIHNYQQQDGNSGSQA